jgi:hypothetical protein
MEFLTLSGSWASFFASSMNPLLAMMIAASGYAAVILPPDARIPLHLGEQPGRGLGAGVRDVLTPAVMVVVLGFQVGALVVGAGGRTTLRSDKRVLAT